MPDDFDPVATSLGATTQRAAEAMLRALGDGGIVLRLPLPAGLDHRDLGLAGPVTEDVELSPALLQVVEPLAGGGARYEAAIAAESVEEEMERRNLGTPEAFFAAVLGIVAGDKLLRIVSATPHSCGGAVYLYRLEARG